MATRTQTRCTKLRLSTQDSSSGFTLVELIVATLVASAILTASLALINEQRRQVLGTQALTQSKQNLRAAMDLIGTDAKLAGERLELISDYEELPGISLVDGGGAAPDTLTLQRKLIPDRMTVCADLGVGDDTVTVSTDPGVDTCLLQDAGGGPGNVPNGFSDTLDAFSTYRCSQDGATDCARVAPLAAGADCDDECVLAYIHDPVNDRGEFFTYTFETTDDPAAPTLNQIHARPTGPAGNWRFPYPAANLPRIYILEERQFSLNAGILQLSVNRQPAVGLVNQLDDFQVQLIVDADNDPLTAPVTQNAFNPVLPPTAVWQRVERIRVSLQACDASLPACDAFGSDQVTVPLEKRQLTSDFFPRNSLSRPVF